jgi:hypothetical protein
LYLGRYDHARFRPITSHSNTAHAAEDRTVGVNSLVFVIVRDCVVFEAGTGVSGVIQMKGAV